MNKELEEAKQKLEKFIGLFYEFSNPTSISIRDYEVEAIETVLNYIENSISKQTLIEKIRERQFELQQEYKDFKNDIKLNTLQELLEVE